MAVAGNCQLTGKYYPSLDEHHVVPREYGGENGPTIMLGPDIHQTLHRSVTNLETRDGFMSMLPQRSRQAALQLIQSIQIAAEANKSRSKSTRTIDGIKVSMDSWRRIEVIAKERNMPPKKFISLLLESVGRK